jgi:hypothetical protein
MDIESTAKRKRKDLEYLLQGIDLTAIDLDIEISKDSRKIKRLFGLICSLISIGFLCIIFLFLHKYKYI